MFGSLHSIITFFLSVSACIIQQTGEVAEDIGDTVTNPIEAIQSDTKKVKDGFVFLKDKVTNPEDGTED